VTCTRAHGRISFEEALTVSCNIAFGELALELGSDTLGGYVDDFGFTDRISVGGIMSARGNFHRAPNGSTNLAWSGVGQHRNTVCPATMLRFVGAIANEGVAVEMRLLQLHPLRDFFPTSSERIMPMSTAIHLDLMMNYSIQQSESVNNSFPGLQIHAKTGTAEVGGGQTPHAWFAGYITNEDHPYAFVVIVENGGGGFAVASPIANRVLQAAVRR
jgi:peptidoglycan glycosyltransferase